MIFSPSHRSACATILGCKHHVWRPSIFSTCRRMVFVIWCTMLVAELTNFALGAASWKVGWIVVVVTMTLFCFIMLQPISLWPPSTVSAKRAMNAVWQPLWKSPQIWIILSQLLTAWLLLCSCHLLTQSSYWQVSNTAGMRLSLNVGLGLSVALC